MVYCVAYGYDNDSNKEKKFIAIDFLFLSCNHIWALNIITYVISSFECRWQSK